MQHSIILSSDGSNTLKLANYDECYHSGNGAYTEAQHIYIKHGVEHLWRLRNQTPITINIYDMGLGTALNCMVALTWQQNLSKNGLTPPLIHFIGIEKYPISLSEALMLNFPQHISRHTENITLEELDNWFNLIHNSNWEDDIHITENFVLTKHIGDITELKSSFFANNLYPDSPSVIMYDTFSPQTQPQLWDKEIFTAIANGVNPGSILTTYCSKGIVKQALRESGFTIERLQGPPGKRHIIRASL